MVLGDQNKLNMDNKNKINVLGIIGQSISAPFRHSPLLIRRTVLPILLIYVLIHLIVDYSTNGHFSALLNLPFVLLLLAVPIIGVLILMLFTIIAVNSHRTYLLEGEEKSKTTFFSAREWRFLGWILLISIIYFFIDGFFTKIADRFFPEDIETTELNYVVEFLRWTIYMVPTYVWCRFAMIYPATAIDKKLTLGEAWDLSISNSIRLFIAVGIFPSLIMIILFLPYYFDPLSDFIFAQPPHLITLGAITCFLIFSMIEIAAVSFAYKQLTTNTGE
jgi:hypothetical protein